MTQCIDRKQVTEFEREEEKSRATTEKYMRDVSCFLQFLSDLRITHHKRKIRLHTRSICRNSTRRQV